MSKNYNGYFSLCDENNYDDDVVYNLKVENNKIVGASFSVDRSMKKDELEDLLKEVIGEDFKDFLIEKMFDQQHGASWTLVNELIMLTCLMVIELKRPETPRNWVYLCRAIGIKWLLS